MRTLIALTFVLYSVVLLSNTASASNARFWKHCKGDRPSVSACTNIINSGRESRENTARAYNNRGVAYHHLGQYDNAIYDYTQAMRFKSRYALAYSNRGLAYSAKRQYNKAIQDYNVALRINPRDGGTYDNRGLAYSYQGRYDRAIQDHNKAIQLAPNDYRGYNNRGYAYHQKGNMDRAIADYTQAIRNKPNYALAYDNRGLAFAKKRQYHNAVADHTQAIRLKPNEGSYYSNRATAYRNLKQYDLALADYDRAIRLKPDLAVAYTNRGYTYEITKDYDRARQDYYSVLSLPDLPSSRTHKDYAQKAINRLRGKRTPEYVVRKRQDGNRIDNRDNNTVVTRPVERDKIEKDRPKPNFKIGRRLALVIGNSRYTHASALKNPVNDAKAVARALKRLGFVEVIEKYDLSYDELRKTLKEFGDRAVNSDWALIYYAGHGMQVDGKNYVIPVDAQLVHAAHVEEEAISLNRVLSKVREARKLRMVILDACRDNPFTKKMKTSGPRSRSLGRGLSPVEPERGTLVAFAARDGQVADDGRGQHSPYTRALLEHIEKKDLEISLLFRKVRDTVLRRTGRRQEPYVYGSLPGDELYFKK